MKCSEKKIAFVLEYDGTGFHGWQKQVHAPTIQGTLEEMLSKLFCQKILVTGASRTDAGVHALGQVAHALVPPKFEEDALLKSLNALLPEQIAIRSITEATPAFHARFSATKKLYHYYLVNSPHKPLFTRSFAAWVPQPLDMEAMRIAISYLKGSHDFKSFESAGSDTKHTHRNLEQALVVQNGELIRFEFLGRSFLKQMVRNIVGTLLEIGIGKLNPEHLCKILSAKDRRVAAPPAPACGLYLIQIDYPREFFLTKKKAQPAIADKTSPVTTSNTTIPAFAPFVKGELGFPKHTEQAYTG